MGLVLFFEAAMHPFHSTHVSGDIIHLDRLAILEMITLSFVMVPRIVLSPYQDDFNDHVSNQNQTTILPIIDLWSLCKAVISQIVVVSFVLFFCFVVLIAYYDVVHFNRSHLPT